MKLLLHLLRRVTLYFSIRVEVITPDENARKGFTCVSKLDKIGCIIGPKYISIKLSVTGHFTTDSCWMSRQVISARLTEKHNSMAYILKQYLKRLKIDKTKKCVVKMLIKINRDSNNNFLIKFRRSFKTNLCNYDKKTEHIFPCTTSLYSPFDH